MNLQTFKAPTMAEALQQVKSIMGHDAVILHTRTYQRRLWLGLRRQEIVEITAGKGIHVQGRAPRRAAISPRSLGATVPIKTNNPAQNTRELLQTPAVGNAVMLGLSQEMASLKTMVKDLVTQTRYQKCPNVPEELFDYYM